MLVGWVGCVITQVTGARLWACCQKQLQRVGGGGGEAVHAEYQCQ